MTKVTDISVYDLISILEDAGAKAGLRYDASANGIPLEARQLGSLDALIGVMITPEGKHTGAANDRHTNDRYTMSGVVETMRFYSLLGPEFATEGDLRADPVKFTSCAWG